MNDTTTKHQHDPVAQRKSLGTSALAGILILVSFYFETVLLKTAPTIPNYIIRVYFMIGIAVSVATITLIVQNRQDLASRLLYSFVITIPVLAGSLLQGRTVSTSITSLVISSIMIVWILPRPSWRFNAALAAGMMIIAWTLEWLNLPWRVEVASAQVGPAAAILFVLIIAFIAVREAFRFTLRTKLVASFLAVTLIPLIISAYVNDRSTRQALTTEANEKLSGAAQQTAALLDEFMSENINAVRTESQFAATVEYMLLPESERAGSQEEARLIRYLAGASRANPVYMNSIGILDTNGITVIDTEVSAIGRDRSTRYYFQEVLNTNRPYASSVEYDSITKEPSIYFAAPIHNATGEIIGVLRKRFDASVLMEYISAQKGLVGAGSFPVLLDENQMRIAHAANISLIYKLVVPLDPAVVTDLQNKRFLPPGTIENISTDRQDFAEGLKNADTQPYFTADLTGDNQLEQVAVARMKTQNWQVAFAVPQEEFLTLINTQARNNILLTLGIAVLVAVVGFFISQTLSGPIVRLTQTAEAIADGNINIQAKVETGDEIGTLAGTFNRMTAQLRDFINTLESRVAERTRNLELAAEVGRTVSQVRSLDIMLTEAAELIRKQFDLYYVQVYLVNPSQTYLNLQAGTGHVGQELLGRNHRLPFNANSINGRAAVEKKSVVISNTTTSATFKPNPLLPDTRSEMAVPLLIGNRVVGVLDMQSERPDSLSTDVLPAFEALAGQLAITIQNANFLAETEQARAEVEAQAKRLTRTSWVDYLDAIHKPEENGYIFEQNKVTPLDQELETKENALVASIDVTGETLGSLVVELEGQSPIARTDELLSTVARQISQQIENLRLLENAERYRIEAEEASRRLTRESWQEYLAVRKDKKLAYMYDMKEVKPLESTDTPLDSAVNIPIKVGEENIGTIAIQDVANDDAESIQLANAVADRLSKHIESLRLLEKTEEGRAEIEISQERLSEALNIARLGNWEYDVEKDLFTFNDNFYSVFRTTVKDVGSYQISSGEYARRFVHPEDQPVVGGEIGKALTSTEQHYSALIEHRVNFGDGSLGHISVNVHVERDEHGKVTRFYGANQDITERKQAEEVLRAREAELSTVLAETQSLYRINEAISSKTDLETIYQTVAQLSCDEMGFSGSWIGIFEPDSNTLRGVAGINMPEERIYASLPLYQNTPATLAARTHQVVTVNDPVQDERMADLPMDVRERMGKAIATPVMLGQELLGSIAVTRPETAADIGQREERMLQSVAIQLAIVMQRIKLFDQVQKQARRESMLNVISQKIQSATSVEAVLQIAARELGHALGAPMTIAQLSMKEKSS